MDTLDIPLNPPLTQQVNFHSGRVVSCTYNAVKIALLKVLFSCSSIQSYYGYYVTANKHTGSERGMYMTLILRFLIEMVHQWHTHTHTQV